MTKIYTEEDIIRVITMRKISLRKIYAKADTMK
jgi:hypothetical protein